MFSSFAWRFPSTWFSFFLKPVIIFILLFCRAGFPTYYCKCRYTTSASLLTVSAPPSPDPSLQEAPFVVIQGLVFEKHLPVLLGMMLMYSMTVSVMESPTHTLKTEKMNSLFETLYLREGCRWCWTCIFSGRRRGTPWTSGGWLKYFLDGAHFCKLVFRSTLTTYHH